MFMAPTCLLLIAIVNVSCGRSTYEYTEYNSKKYQNDICIGTSQGVLFPYPKDCTKFYKCDEFGQAVEMSCVDGYHFDPVRRHCRRSSLAGCAASSNAPSSSTLSTEISKKSPPPPRTTPSEKPSTTTAASFTKSTSSTNTYSPPNGNICKIQEHGAKIPYPNDCEKYVVCVWGTPVTMNCPESLHFNAKLKVCDWTYSAGCNPRSN